MQRSRRSDVGTCRSARRYSRTRRCSALRHQRYCSLQQGLSPTRGPTSRRLCSSTSRVPLRCGFRPALGDRGICTGGVRPYVVVSMSRLNAQLAHAPHIATADPAVEGRYESDRLLHIIQPLLPSHCMNGPSIYPSAVWWNAHGTRQSTMPRDRAGAEGGTARVPAHLLGGSAEGQRPRVACPAAEVHQQPGQEVWPVPGRNSRNLNVLELHTNLQPTILLSGFQV